MFVLFELTIAYHCMRLSCAVCQCWTSTPTHWSTVSQGPRQGCFASLQRAPTSRYGNLTLVRVLWEEQGQPFCLSSSLTPFCLLRLHLISFRLTKCTSKSFSTYHSGFSKSDRVSFIIFRGGYYSNEFIFPITSEIRIIIRQNGTSLRHPCIC